MAHRKFGQTIRPVETEPITFDIAHEEGINCRDRVNGKLLMELVGKVDSGSVTEQTSGILQVFDVCVRTDDGEKPDKYTGKRFDPRRPLENHTQAELDAIGDENADIRDRNVAIRDENDQREPDAEPKPYEDYVQPGIDPTSSWARLNVVLNDPDTDIAMEQLAEVVGWLVEQYTGRPTKNAASSRRGTASTNRSSRRASRSSELTSVPATTPGS